MSVEQIPGAADTGSKALIFRCTGVQVFKLYTKRDMRGNGWGDQRAEEGLKAWSKHGRSWWLSHSPYCALRELEITALASPCTVRLGATAQNPCHLLACCGLDLLDSVSGWSQFRS